MERALADGAEDITTEESRAGVPTWASHRRFGTLFLVLPAVLRQTSSDDLERLLFGLRDTHTNSESPDPKEALRLLRSSGSAPTFPNQSWKELLEGSFLDFDVINKELFGGGIISTEEDWSRVWRVVEQAMGFAFLKQGPELRTYGTYILDFRPTGGSPSSSRAPHTFGASSSEQPTFDQEVITEAQSFVDKYRQGVISRVKAEAAIEVVLERGASNAGTSYTADLRQPYLDQLDAHDETLCEAQVQGETQNGESATIPTPDTVPRTKRKRTDDDSSDSSSDNDSDEEEAPNIWGAANRWRPVVDT
ncbi:hypothetical protein VNI00_017506 [Paramarasmius palmivorus]|uniref:Uncharacterized protein n=1 Tax=Paramarasmius palmivorus TaxID=297713 RepID=A0AAW0B607_9AGAR